MPGQSTIHIQKSHISLIHTNLLSLASLKTWLKPHHIFTIPGFEVQVTQITNFHAAITFVITYITPRGPFPTSDIS
ncbi:hypothetical protein PR048_028440 [Dryococelus australis]|uniref:Uncharacterized protein n=1 Tax=Dryococelus australis TaxID=614101 RepID=A0ABQ9GAK2_9NEOP|nr:hypothetical protein PR048_028440 [Dryococelus australis]